MKSEEVLFNNIHQDIIDRCRKGEQKAQFQLYKLYFKAMYNTSLRIVNDQMLAEDVMQEAFLKAFDKIETYSGKVSFGAWLKRIVVNHSLDELKKRKLETDPISDSIITDDKSTYDNFEGQELNYKVEQIKQAINELPDGYRIVLSLYLLEGYDHDEIADILNITNSTSRSQFVRAKKKLTEILKENYNIS